MASLNNLSKSVLSRIPRKMMKFRAFVTQKNRRLGEMKNERFYSADTLDRQSRGRFCIKALNLLICMYLYIQM
jgi:hypothetical protein